MIESGEVPLDQQVGSRVIAFSTLLFSLATVIYLALAGWRRQIGGGRRASMFLVLGFIGMAASAAAGLVDDLPVALVGEAVRNAAWCVYLSFIIRHDRSFASQARIARLPGYLIGLTLFRTTACLLLLILVPGWIATLFLLATALAFCIGALVLLHSLFFAAHQTAAGFKLLLFALAALWAYDLNIYAATLLGFDVSALVTVGQALLALLLAPLFAIAARRKEHWSLSPSRTITFQSLSLVAIGSWFILLSMIAGVRPWLGGTLQAIAGTALVVVAFCSIVAIAVSARVRARLRVFVSKHLFKHRYDYRIEWLRFNATINSGSLTGLSPEQRAIKALADIMDAQGGVLFLSSAQEQLEHAGDLDWSRMLLDDQIPVADALRTAVQTESHIMVSPRYRDHDDATPFPEGLPVDGSVWLAVPLVRVGSLVGLVALGRPRVPRRLDWEDFDLLKVLGQQIATYIADARRQAESEEARQYEEFNRRFAFIVHDIKNVVSQLSLVAANAAEHGANPRFQADMMSTLSNSVTKMTTLLSRLSLDRSTPDVALTELDATQLLEQIAQGRRSQHPVLVTTGPPVSVLADPVKLSTALDHLVQNAIEASAPDEQVILSAYVRDGCGVVSVLDNGGGMSGDFIRRQLFKPFASTKAAGFGIGAGEAQSLVRQMGGKLEVQSVEGVGTSFIIELVLGNLSEGSGT